MKVEPCDNEKEAVEYIDTAQTLIWSVVDADFVNEYDEDRLKQANCILRNVKEDDDS